MICQHENISRRQVTWGYSTTLFGSASISQGSSESVEPSVPGDNVGVPAFASSDSLDLLHQISNQILKRIKRKRNWKEKRKERRNNSIKNRFQYGNFITHKV